MNEFLHQRQAIPVKVCPCPQQERSPVFASFMLSTLARTLGVVPGGLGVFEAVSVTTLKLIGVPVAAGLAATLLFRVFTFWLPISLLK